MRTKILLFCAIILVFREASLLEMGSVSSFGQHLGHQSAVPNLLMDMMSGPLLGRSVTLLIQEETSSSLILQDTLIANFKEPVFLLRLPAVEVKYNTSDDEVTFGNTTFELDNFNGSQVPFDLSSVFPTFDYYHLTYSVLVIIVEPNSYYWWPFWFPPSDWKPEAVILIVSSLPCSAEIFMKTPLLSRMSSVAILCPHVIKKPSLTLDFKVWSWKPYAIGSKLVDLGICNSECFLDWDQLFIDRFKDMSQKNMSILCTSYDWPFMEISKEGIIKGINYNIMNTLRWWLKFDLKYITIDYMMFDTILDSIKRGENDVFIQFASMTPERSEEFDFTVPYHREGFAFILEIPPPLPRWQSIFFPFTWWVWVGIIISTILSTVTYHMVNRRYEPSFNTNAFIVWQSLLSNPLDKEPTNWQSRNYLLVWWMFTWFITMSYTCNLIAVLTIPVFPRKIQTAEELTNSHYRLCMVDYGEFVDEALATSDHPVLFKLSQILTMVQGEIQCNEFVLEGTHAHIDTYSYVKILYSMMGYENKVYTLREQLYQGYLVFILRKHTPWKYKFNTGIQWLFETGIIQKWYKDSMEGFKEHVEEKQAELLPFTLGHLQGPFLFCALGLLISVLAMVWEIIRPPRK